MQLVFASANKNKIKEIGALLPEGYTLLSLTDIGINEDIPETGKTIPENSLIKARFVAEHLKKAGKNYAVFADDSGLEVSILNGAPGVYSARYAGVPKNDAANNDKLLHELDTSADRKSRFVTVITLLQGKEIHVFEGEVKGTIGFEARGNEGFGYDPLFIPAGYRSTFAELGLEFKNTISHRAIAFRKLVDYLKGH